MVFESKKLWQGAGALALALACAAPQVAHAGGLEDTVGGAIGLGRSAYFARVNDFMAILQNPANLSILPRGDLGVELRLPLLVSCYDRAFNPEIAAKYKQDGMGGFGESFDQVCNDFHLSPTANIGWARSYENGLGWGIGLFTPAAGGGSASFGSHTIRTIGLQPADAAPEFQERYTPTLTGLESPARQMGLERDGVIAYLMMGLGYQPVKQIRFGVGAGIGFAHIYNKNVVSSVGGDFSKFPEIVNELYVKDYAIPKASASVVVSPADFMDIYGGAIYQGDINASGYTDLTANGIRGVPRGNCYDAQLGVMPADPATAKRTGSHCRVNGAKLTVPQPTFEATAGIRFSHRRNKRVRALDPMKDEKWDFEVDWTWSQTSRVDQFTATIHDQLPGRPGAPTIELYNRSAPANPQPIQASSIIPKHWKDSWTIRAGGDVNIVPEVFSLRLGGSYSPRAMDIGYTNIDFAMPIQKIGVHGGATLALGNYRVTVAYAHLFYETITVPIGQGKLKDITAVFPERAASVNEGTFAGGLDVFSLQLNAQF